MLYKTGMFLCCTFLMRMMCKGQYLDCHAEIFKSTASIKMSEIEPYFYLLVGDKTSFTCSLVIN